MVSSWWVHRGHSSRSCCSPFRSSALPYRSVVTPQQVGATAHTNRSCTGDDAKNEFRRLRRSFGRWTVGFGQAGVLGLIEGGATSGYLARFPSVGVEQAAYTPPAELIDWRSVGGRRKVRIAVPAMALSPASRTNRNRRYGLRSPAHLRGLLLRLCG